MKGGLTSAREKALRVIGVPGWARVGQGMYTSTAEDPVVTPTGAAWLVDMGYAEVSAADEKRLDLSEAGLAAFHNLPADEDPGDEPVESVADRDEDTDGDEDTDVEVDDDAAPVVTGGRLPEFEGIIPIGVVTTLTGTSQRINRAIHYGETGHMVIKWEANNVGHNKTADGMKRTHKITMVDGYELTGPGAKRLFNQLADEHRRATEADPLPFKARGDEALVAEFVAGRTDASGVAMTPEELADLGFTDTSPVIVIFAAGTRAIWPDDFPVETSRPRVGERLDVPGATYAEVVVELLDHATGKRVAVWDDEDLVDDPPGAGDEEG